MVPGRKLADHILSRFHYPMSRVSRTAIDATPVARLRHLVAGGLVLLVAGCSALPEAGSHRAYNEWTYTTTVTYLPTETNSDLEQANIGATLLLDSSPWGEHARIQVQDRFFAASGRPCLAALIEAEGIQPFAANLCQYTNQRWGSTRAFQVQAMSDIGTEDGNQP